MTPEMRSTLTALVALASAPVDTSNVPASTADVTNRFNIHSALTTQGAVPSALDPSLYHSLRMLKGAYDAGYFEGADVTAYEWVVAALASQTTRDARIALGVAVETLTPHL